MEAVKVTKALKKCTRNCLEKDTSHHTITTVLYHDLATSPPSPTDRIAVYFLVGSADCLAIFHTFDRRDQIVQIYIYLRFAYVA